MCNTRTTLLKKIINTLLLLLLTIFCFLTLMGCQSIDKEESFFDTSGIEYSQFEFDSLTNRTKIKWATTLTNDTIYNINGFSVKFNLYNNSSLVTTDTYNYTCSIKNGDNYTDVFYFYADGEIDNIEYVAWSAKYDTFWVTYKIWLIATIVISSIIALIYIIVMIIQDLELEEVYEFIEENMWTLFSLILPIGIVIFGLVTSSWVPVIIVIGGLIASIIIALIAHLIKYIVEKFPGFNWQGGDNYIALNNKKYESIGSVCLDSSEKLENFTVNDLKNYCRENDINGFSSLNKAQLIELIISSNNNGSSPSSNISVEKNSNSMSPKKITFANIVGLKEVKKAFKEKVIYAFENKELYEKYGKTAGGGLLLYGLPGTGKTLFAEAASNETDALFLPIKCSDIKSKWYGESEKKVKSIFDKARRAQKAIIFFDEFEAIGSKRTDDNDNGNNDLVPQILAEMQGISKGNSQATVLVIAATNKPWAIDSAFLRPGRFDEKIYIPLPDYEARKKLFELKLKSIPQQELDYNYLAETTNGFNGADIGEFCEKLKMAAINRAIETGNESPITMEDVSIVAKIVKTSVAQEDIERLENFMK